MAKTAYLKSHRSQLKGPERETKHNSEFKYLAENQILRADQVPKT